MECMKRKMKFLIVAILIIVGIRVVTLKYQDQPEDFADAQKWMDLGKEKVESGIDHLSTFLEEKGWNIEIEGIYDIDAKEEEREDVITYIEGTEIIQLNDEEIENLTIQAAGCRVYIMPSEAEFFTTTFDHMKKVEVAQAGNELFIKTVRETKFQEDQYDAVLYLYIPANAKLEMVELQLGAGSMEVKELQTDDLQVSVEAGKLLVNELSAETISVNCTAGNVQLAVLGKEDTFNYVLKSTAGNIALNQTLYSGIKEETTIENGADKLMNLNCAVGNIEVNFTER